MIYDPLLEADVQQYGVDRTTFANESCVSRFHGSLPTWRSVFSRESLSAFFALRRKVFGC